MGSALIERDAAAWLDAPTEPWDVLVVALRLQQGNGLALLAVRRWACEQAQKAQKAQKADLASV